MVTHLSFITESLIVAIKQENCIYVFFSAQQYQLSSSTFKLLNSSYCYNIYYMDQLTEFILFLFEMGKSF